MRLLSTILTSLALVLVTHSAVAVGKGPSAGNAAGRNANGAIKTETPVTFTITAAQCPSLPAGTVLQGSGELRTIVNTHASRGITRQTTTAHASGTATDQAGNTYAWVYANQLNETNTPPSLNWFGRISTTSRWPAAGRRTSMPTSLLIAFTTRPTRSGS